MYNEYPFCEMTGVPLRPAIAFERISFEEVRASPFTPQLFILFCETLVLYIKQENMIKGIHIYERE